MSKYHEIMDLQEQLTDKEFVKLFYETFGIERLFEDFKDYVRSIEDEEQYDEILNSINKIMKKRKTNK